MYRDGASGLPKRPRLDDWATDLRGSNHRAENGSHSKRRSDVDIPNFGRDSSTTQPVSSIIAPSQRAVNSDFFENDPGSSLYPPQNGRKLPVPPGRYSESSGPNVGKVSHDGNGNGETVVSTDFNSTEAASRNMDSEERPLRDFVAVETSIRHIDGRSPALSTLAKLCGLHDAQNKPADYLKEYVLNFRGWAVDNKGEDMKKVRDEKRLSLAMRNKNELLEIVQILNLARSGNKADLVDRIIVYLLKPTSSAKRKRPITRTSMRFKNRNCMALPKRTPAKQTQESSTIITGPPTDASSLPMRSMPVFNAPQERPDMNLARVRYTATGGASNPPSKPIRTGLGWQYDALIDRFDPFIPESPFYVNWSEPLGARKYLAFHSTQLDNGEADQVLTFPSPQSIPRVEGHDVQVHLRCILVYPKKDNKEWIQLWPFPVMAKVNGFPVALNQAQRYTNGKLAGVDTATNIMPYLKKKTGYGEVMNRVILKRSRSSGLAATGTFLLFAQQVLVKTTAQVAKEVNEQSEKFRQERKAELPQSDREKTDLEIEKDAVKHFMNDEGVVTESIRISLRCPLSFCRIEIPVKGKACAHIQCFDLTSFVEYSRKSFKFECPVCNQKTAQPADLVVSTFFSDILGRFQKDSEVEVLADASVRTPLEAKQVTRTPDKSQVYTSLRDGSEYNGQVDSTAVKAKKEPLPTSSDEVIDLTLDDDSEGGEAGRKNTTDFAGGDGNRSGCGSDDNGMFQTAFRFFEPTTSSAEATRNNVNSLLAPQWNAFNDDETIVLSD